MKCPQCLDQNKLISQEHSVKLIWGWIIWWRVASGTEPASFWRVTFSFTGEFLHHKNKGTENGTKFLATKAFSLFTGLWGDSSISTTVCNNQRLTNQSIDLNPFIITQSKHLFFLFLQVVACACVCVCTHEEALYASSLSVSLPSVWRWEGRGSAVKWELKSVECSRLSHRGARPPPAETGSFFSHRILRCFLWRMPNSMLQKNRFDKCFKDIKLYITASSETEREKWMIILSSQKLLKVYELNKLLSCFVL